MQTGQEGEYPFSLEEVQTIWNQIHGRNSQLFSVMLIRPKKMVSLVRVYPSPSMSIDEGSQTLQALKDITSAIKTVFVGDFNLVHTNWEVETCT